MKTIAPAAMAAIEAGEAIVTGAVMIAPNATVALPEFFDGFAGLSWLLPNTGPGSPPTSVCACSPGTSDSFDLTGDPDVLYDVAVRIRGIVELNAYSGGTPQIPSYVVKDATSYQTSPAVNVYKLTVSNPAAVYYLNNGTFDQTDAQALDYIFTFPAQGDATLTFESISQDNFEVKNVGNHTVADDDPSFPIVVTQPYDGQFMQMDGIAAVFTPGAIRIWGGYGPITIDGQDFDGIGDKGLAQQTAGAIGGVAQGITLSLSGIEPDLLELLDAREIKSAPVVIYRLIFAGDGKTLLDAHVFDRGRVDTVDSSETIGGKASIRVNVESAARGLGRSGVRMRSDSDQRLINSSDGYFKNTAYAGQKQLYWGGKRPARAGSVLGGGGSGTFVVRLANQ